MKNHKIIISVAVHLSRRLSLNGNSPPLTDVADASYVIKPVIGHALKHIYETDAQTLLILDSASASTKPHWRTNEGQPYHVLDRWINIYILEIEHCTTGRRPISRNRFRFATNCTKDTDPIR